MKIEKLILENFRAFKDKTEIDLDKLNVFVGKNDIGKSSILEALDIFLNESDATVKIDKDDLSSNSTGQEINIAIVFSGFPDKIIVDTTVKTSLADEFLLNESGYLEIHKKYRNGKLIQTFILANHPENELLNSLFLLKKDDLKRIVEEKGLIVEDKRKSSLMRRAIRESLDDISLSGQLIPIDQEGAKQIWDQLKLYLPVYGLFQSDRANKDNDDEIQDPMKLAIREILKKEELQESFRKIEEEVSKTSNEIAKLTIDKLKEMNPDLAQHLQPMIPDPKWETVFKGITISSDDDIPLNKRGSGVRRLVLLNFFRAEAERKATGRNVPNIIYAIEEPETSQHPNHQKQLIKALIEISEKENFQILLTTHSPAIAQLLPKNSLNLVHKKDGVVIIEKEDETILSTIVNSLGILPIYSKVVCCVEGENDICFLRNINKNIPEINQIIDLESQRIKFIPMIGSNLINWAERYYLENSNVVEFHIYDKDDSSKYAESIQRIENRPDKSIGFLTIKRELENYVHPSLIENEFNISCREIIDNWDNVDVPLFVRDNCAKYRVAMGSGGEAAKKAEMEIKSIINGKLSKLMTKDLLLKIKAFDEIEDWFEQIKKLMIYEV